MTNLKNINENKKVRFDPYDPFNNPMENKKYNGDYSEIFDGIDDNRPLPLVPDAAESRKIRKYYNIAGFMLIAFSLISYFLPALALKGLFETIKLSDAAAGIETGTYSYYYEMMHTFTDNSSVSIAVVVLIHLVFNTLIAFIGLKLIKIQPKELFAEPVGLNKKIVLRYVFLALGVQIILSYVLAAVSNYLMTKGIDITTATSFSSTSPKAVVMNIIGCCIVAPLTEELLFRGFAMKALGRVSQRFAIFMSAFIFGMAHGNIPQFVTAFFIGIIFGYVDIKHNSLLPSVIIHFAVNVFTCILNYTNMLDGGAGRFVQYIVSGVTIAVLFIGIVSFLFTIRTDKIPYNTPEQSMRSNAMVIKSVGLTLLIIVEIVLMVLGYILK